MAIRYPFSPELLDAIPEELAELYRGLEIKLLREICSRLKAADTLNEVTVQDIRALRSHGISLKEIQKAIRETSGISQKKLDALFDDVIARNQRYYEEIIDLAEVTKPDRLIDEADIAAIRKQTQNELRNITRSMGFLIDNGKTMLMPAKVYQTVLDNALNQVESGAMSYNQVIREAVIELADSGLCVAYDKKGNLLQNHVSYESGHHDQVDVAVRRAVMTGINQINQKYREQSMDYLETDLVETTAHLGARNVQRPGEPDFVRHDLWQGRVYRWRR